MKKFLETFILILSIFLFLYTFYKSEIILNGAHRNEYNIYYLLSFVLFCFSVIIFFLKKEIKIYFLISFISIFVTLYFFETYLILSSSKLNSTKNKIEFFEKLKKEDKDIAVTVYPSGNIFNKENILALSGISNSKTVFCNEYKEYSIYESDRYGFNNPDEEWEKKKY